MRVDQFLIRINGAFEREFVRLPSLPNLGIDGPMAPPNWRTKRKHGRTDARRCHGNGDQRKGKGTQNARESKTKPRTEQGISPSDTAAASRAESGAGDFQRISWWHLSRTGAKGRE